MSVSVSMPQLGESVTEGTVTRWLKKEGERVEADEPLLEVSTDKVDTEIPSPVAGILRGITVAEDETVAVGAELAVIDEDGAEAAAPAPGTAPGRTARPNRPRPLGSPEDAYSAGGQEPVAESPTEAGYPYPAAGGYQGGSEPAAGSQPPAAYEPPARRRATASRRRPSSRPRGHRQTWASPAARRRSQPQPPRPAGRRSVTSGSGPSRPGPHQPRQPRPRHRPRPRRRPAAAVGSGRPASRAAGSPGTPQPGAPGGSGPARPASPLGTADGPYVTPLVRKLAAEHGVDLATVTGTGVGGRIRKQDVVDAARVRREAIAAAQQSAAADGQAAARQPAAGPARPGQPAQGGASRPPIEPSHLRGTTERMSRARQLIARRMVESLQTSAQLTTVVEVDVTAIARLRDRAKADFEAREGVKLTFLPFFALAAVEALKVHPRLNASIEPDGNQVTYHDAEHLGIAVDTERGLMVPGHPQRR